MNTLRWAILGASRIALGVLPRLAEACGCEVVAVASRSPSRAAAFPATGLMKGDPARHLCTAEDLASRHDVDAVYVTLMNHEHEHACAALLRAGKHVLCEKPLTPRAAQARRLADLARDHAALCVEGFMYLHHPQTTRLIELARAGPSGPLGTLRAIRCHRNVRSTDPHILHSRLSHAMQGGALMDIGCYPVSIARLLAGEEPDLSTLTARVRWGAWRGDKTQGQLIRPASGEFSPTMPAPTHDGLNWVDESCAFNWTFPSGVRFEGQTSFSGGFPTENDPRPAPSTSPADTTPGVFVELVGDRASAFTTHPFSPDPVRQTLRITRADGQTREEVFEAGGSPFTNQFEHFARAVHHAVAPLPSIEWSIAQAATIEAIHRRIGLRYEGE